MSRRTRFVLAVFATYVVGSLALGEAFPFSNFTMFARARDENHAIVFRADGRRAEPGDYTRFKVRSRLRDAGDPGNNAGLLPYEMDALLRERAAPPGDPDGPVAVTCVDYGAFWDPDSGEVFLETEVLCEGTAWPRP